MAKKHFRPLQRLNGHYGIILCTMIKKTLIHCIDSVSFSKCTLSCADALLEYPMLINWQENSEQLNLVFYTHTQCTTHCSIFCGNSKGSRVMLRKPKSVVDEIKTLSKVDFS